MDQKRGFSLALTAIFLSALTLVVGGCFPLSSIGSWIRKPTLTIRIDASCEVSSDPAETEAGALVEFCNDAGCMITIVFESDDLFGRSSLRLGEGECVSLRVMSDAAGHTYLYDVDCDCTDYQGHSTPEIKVAPPPPP